MLFDGNRVIGASLNCRVVSDDHDLSAMYHADAGDDAPCGRFITIVHAVTRQHRKFEKRTIWVEQTLNPLAHQQFAALGMTFTRAFGPSLANSFDFTTQARHLLFH